MESSFQLNHRLEDGLVRYTLLDQEGSHTIPLDDAVQRQSGRRDEKKGNVERDHE